MTDAGTYQAGRSRISCSSATLPLGLSRSMLRTIWLPVTPTAASSLVFSR